MTRSRFTSIWLTLVFAVAATVATRAANAAEDNGAPPPTVHVGDVWVDRLSSGDKEFKVTSVTADAISYTQWAPKKKAIPSGTPPCIAH